IASGTQHPSGPGFAFGGWFLERIEDVWGEDGPPSGLFVSGPDYKELFLPSGRIKKEGRGGGSWHHSNVKSVPLSVGENWHISEAEILYAHVTGPGYVRQEGVPSPLHNLTLERVKVGFGERYSDSYYATHTLVFEQTFEQQLQGYSLASRAGEYALAIGAHVAPEEGEACGSRIHWLSRELSFELEGCPGVFDSLFTQDGSYWSLWTDGETNDSLRLFRWGPEANEPREVGLEMRDIWAQTGTGTLLS